MQQFINAVTTNTTYFFREPDHFDTIRDAIASRVAAGQRRFRLWCAASSSGQEPYTLAMVLYRSFTEQYLDLAILATDIDTDILKRAHAGVYPTSALDKVPKEYQSTCFEPHPDGVRVIEPVRQLVRFGQLNLDKAPYRMAGPLDLIICRNVMIYFDEATRRVLVGQFERLLSPTGLLVIGHSESLQGLGSRFQNVEPSVYSHGRMAA
ncbi:MAG: protein-glutamate O-methyltransferase CheR [Myxococcota bacterium]